MIDDALTDYENMCEAHQPSWTKRTYINCNRRVGACNFELSERNVGSKIAKGLVEHGQMSCKHFQVERCRSPRQEQL
jgi:hypothetical protein